MRQAMGWMGALLALITVAVDRVLLTVVPPALLRMGIVNATRDLQTILKEAKEIKDKYAGQEMPLEVSEKWQGLLAEGKTLQDAAERDAEFKSLEAFGRSIAPEENVIPAGKSEQKANRDDETIGYISVGELFAKSAEFANYLNDGMPLERGSGAVDVKNLHERFVPISRKQHAQLMESKAVPTFTVNVIERDRVADVVRTVERDELNIRGVIQVAPTNSNMVEWVTYSPTRAAAPVADTALKPEAALAQDTGTAVVRTLAVWIPVTEQQIQDVPGLVALINNELLYDLGKHEEEQIIWGPGTGQHLTGIARTTGVNAGRAVSGDGFVERVFRARTDIMRDGFRANAVLADPIDIEGVALTREGTGGGYLYNIVQNQVGAMQIAGIRVVESEAMTDPFYVGTTAPRRAIVGDFLRGATLYDRQQANVQLGFKNDDFIRNLRTIRAEERVALAVKRVRAFRTIETQAAVV